MIAEKAQKGDSAKKLNSSKIRKDSYADKKTEKKKTMETPNSTAKKRKHPNGQSSETESSKAKEEQILQKNFKSRDNKKMQLSFAVNSRHNENFLESGKLEHNYFDLGESSLKDALGADIRKIKKSNSENNAADDCNIF